MKDKERMKSPDNLNIAPTPENQEPNPQALMKEKENQELVEAFLNTVESKLRKSEKENWMIPDHDHQK